MLVLLSSLIESAISKHSTLHGWVVHLETHLHRLVKWLHESTGVLHNLPLHGLHFQRKHGVAPVLLESQYIHDFFHFSVLKHGLHLSVDAEGQWSTKSTHSCTIRRHSDHTRWHWAWIILITSSSNLTDHLETWSLWVTHNPLSAHLEFLGKWSHDIDI